MTTTTEQSRLMAHHFKHACTYHLAYRAMGYAGANYGQRNIHISQVASLTGQSFNAVRFLVEVCTTTGPELYPAPWVGLRTAEDIEAEYREETKNA